MDPIADMFTRIKNGYAVSKETVSIPYSRVKAEIAKVLQKNGYIKETARRGRRVKKNLEITLLYGGNGEPAMSGIKRMSKTSRRIYISCKDIFPIKRGLGLMIVSTPKGIMSGVEAKKQKVGGEVIAKVW